MILNDKKSFHLFPESEVAQSCLTLCNLMDCSPPGFSVHEISQARVLEWGASLEKLMSIKKIFPYLITAKSLQSCPALCNPIDGSPPGSPIPGILQARTLEWVAISFFNA